MSAIEQPPQVTIAGRSWHLFAVDYRTADGTFSVYIYALSFEHAAAITLELKETATLRGQVVGVIPN